MGVGADLKAAREAKKIPLDKVSERTKIPAKYLEAIEEGQFDIFPSHTYAKGFIRAYGKVVGLDPAILTRQFNAEVAPVEVAIQPKNAETELEKNLGWRPALDRPPVFRRNDEEPDLSLEMVEDESTQHDPSVMRQRNFALRRGKWAQGAGKAVTALLVLALAGGAVYYGAQLVSKIKWSSPKPAETAATDNLTYQPAAVADKYQHLILKGLDKSWVQVTMDDGQATSEVDLDQGETKTYKALKSFRVKLGNAGGVQIQFNRKPLGILGTTGQVVEIQLPSGSVGNDGTSDSGNSGT